METTGERIAEVMRLAGQPVPEGLRLVTLAEQPDIADDLEAQGQSVWPEFLEHDEVADRHWHHLREDFASFQIALVEEDGTIIASARSAPLSWDGTALHLPHGWDDQLERTVLDLRSGVPANTLGALLIVVDPDRRGEHLGGRMIGAFRACAEVHGFRWLIACVRPTLKERYPLVPIEAYARWTRGDGLPFDPWIRLHLRAGGRIARPEPQSMRIAGTVADWEAWTGMAFPDSGPYVVPGAASVVEIDRGLDVGLHHDPNVWIVHDVMVKQD
jgi:GNAT superfamily N-acetyltransferase